MNLDYNKALVRRAVEEVWNKGDLSVIPEVYAPDFVSHQHSHPNMRDVRGVDGLVAFLREFREAFPDFHDTIHDQVAEGDKVVTRLTSAGTHRGPLMGLQPTNKRASWMAISIDRIEGGKIVEAWDCWDMFGMMQQLAVQDRAATADVERSVQFIQTVFDRGDADTLRGLMTEDHVSMMTYAQFSSAAELLKALSNYNFSEYKISELKVKPLTTDVAIARHQATIKGTYKGSNVPSPVKVTTVWVKRGGKWLQSSYQESPVPIK